MATSEQLEFWGTIIKAGQSVRVDIDEDDEEHVSLSLVALGSSSTEEEKEQKQQKAILSVVEDVGVNDRNCASSTAQEVLVCPHATVQQFQILLEDGVPLDQVTHAALPEVIVPSQRL